MNLKIRVFIIITIFVLLIIDLCLLICFSINTKNENNAPNDAPDDVPNDAPKCIKSYSKPTPKTTTAPPTTWSPSTEPLYTQYINFWGAYGKNNSNIEPPDYVKSNNIIGPDPEADRSCKSELRKDNTPWEFTRSIGYNWWNEAQHGVGRLGEGKGYPSRKKYPDEITYVEATSWPSPNSIGCAFDKDLYYKLGYLTGQEARGIANVYFESNPSYYMKSFDDSYNSDDRNFSEISQYAGLTFWSPSVNILMDPRWGRANESPGDDPINNANFGLYFTRGLQGYSFDGAKSSVLQASACLKHYPLYQWEEGRFKNFPIVTKDEMNNIFLPCFASAAPEVTGIMCAYGGYTLDNIKQAACGDATYLTEKLRNEMGFRGYIVSDCGKGIREGLEGAYNCNNDDCIKKAIDAGMDLNCAYNNGILYEPEKLRTLAQSDEAYKNKLLDLHVHTKETLRMLGFKNDGSFDRGTWTHTVSNDMYDNHSKIALEAAEKSIVMVKHYNSSLPMNNSLTSPTNVVLLGEPIDWTDDLLGGSCNEKWPSYSPCRTPVASRINPLTGSVYDVNAISIKQAFLEAEQRGDISFDYQNNYNENGVNYINDGSVVVVCAGLPWGNQHEGLDLSDNYDFESINSQAGNLINACIAKKNILNFTLVLIIISGSALDISQYVNENAMNNIFWAGFPGQEGGYAIYNLLNNKSPTGKLAFTWYTKDYINNTQEPRYQLSFQPVQNETPYGRSHMGMPEEYYNNPLYVSYKFGHGEHYSNLTQTVEAISDTLKFSQSEINNQFENSIFDPISRNDYSDRELGVIIRVTVSRAIDDEYDEETISIPVILGVYPPEGVNIRRITNSFETIKNLKKGESQCVEFTLNVWDVSTFKGNQRLTTVGKWTFTSVGYKNGQDEKVVIEITAD